MPSFSRLPSHRSPDLCSFQFPLRGHNDFGIVFERESCSIRSTQRSCLPHNDRWKDLLPQIGFALRHRDHNHISYTGRRNPSQTSVVSSDVNQFQLFRSSVVSTRQTRADRKASSYSGPVLYHSAGAYCSRLRCWHVYSATAFLSITTNETSLLSGRHSAMVTLSPVASAIHGGL